MSRNHTTTEQLNINLNIDSQMADTSSGLAILDGSVQTKWMTKESSRDYAAAILAQRTTFKAELSRDPHSRRLVVVGPPGGCWLSTQFLSTDDDDDDGYALIATYRSMDKDHVRADTDIQAAICYIMGVEATSFHFNIGSFHEYK